METPTVAPEARQAIVDEVHLKLLVVGYWIEAGVAGLGAMFGLFYAAMGGLVGVMAAKMPAKPGQEPPEFIGWIFGLFGGAFFLFFVVNAVLKALTARSLSQRRSRTFCMVIGGLTCLGMPYGTLLGVGTLMVLSRPSIQALFGSGKAQSG